MRLLRLAALASLCLVLTGAARAETKVELKGVHLCCGQCVKAVEGILKKEGLQGKCDRENKTVTITAPDAKAAQKGLDALAAAGFHGESSDKELAMKTEADAPAGKVKSLKISGAHNCCGACCKAIKTTVGKVAGVTGDTAQPRSKTFEVTGDFDAAELVKALQAAGFHVKVEK